MLIRVWLLIVRTRSLFFARFMDTRCHTITVPTSTGVSDNRRHIGGPAVLMLRVRVGEYMCRGCYISMLRGVLVLK